MVKELPPYVFLYLSQDYEGEIWKLNFTHPYADKQALLLFFIGLFFFCPLRHTHDYIAWTSYKQLEF